MTFKTFLTVCCIFALAPVLRAQKIEQWSRFELELHSKGKPNNFTDVDLTCTFSNKDTSYMVQGFYDGSDVFKVRFMPQQTGTWRYATSSNVAELNHKSGSFECIKAAQNNHGIIRVSDVHNFRYADGNPFAPFGTTSYAWTQMADTLEEITLQSLRKASFNKVRMCVFPKNYDLVREAPVMFPFVLKSVKKDEKGNEVYEWDFDHFNPAFFQHLEKRIDDLNKLGIQADLILFHPYDMQTINGMAMMCLSTVPIILLTSLPQTPVLFMF